MNKEFVSIDNVMLNMLDGLGGMNQISESEHDQMLNRFILVHKTQEGPNKAIFPFLFPTHKFWTYLHADRQPTNLPWCLDIESGNGWRILEST